MTSPDGSWIVLSSLVLADANPEIASTSIVHNNCTQERIAEDLQQKKITVVQWR